MHNSSKKMLMPSGSSGTLLRKESKNDSLVLTSIVIEMDEVNSSSSSIGREDNVNMALNASSKLKKSNILNCSFYLVAKLNFMGKPFAPDNFFINNMGKNLGDEDDGGDADNMYFN